MAVLALLDLIKATHGFPQACRAFFLASAFFLVESVLILLPVWMSGAATTFTQAYFIYNADYSRFLPWN
jgi:hypothetical protein